MYMHCQALREYNREVQIQSSSLSLQDSGHTATSPPMSPKRKKICFPRILEYLVFEGLTGEGQALSYDSFHYPEHSELNFLC